MIKKKAYEKQNFKTLYDNQAEMVKKQGDFSQYGFEEEYWFSNRRLDVKRQARNIFDFRGADVFPTEVSWNQVDITLPKWNYLVVCVWQTTSSNDAMWVYVNNVLSYKFSWGSTIFIQAIDSDNSQLSFRPISNTGTWTYKPLFISI